MRTRIPFFIRCMKSTRFFSQLAAVILLSAAVVLAVGGVSTFVTFQLDGNATDNDGVNNGATDDWQTLVTGGSTTSTGFQIFSGVIADPGVVNSAGTSVTDQTTFTGSNKDTQDTGTWTGGAGSIPPKDDITNAYAAAYTGTNGHQIIIFGADRFANNGDADLGFWFFVKSTSFNSSTGTFSPAHTAGDTSGKVGDILVLTNFSQTSNFTGTAEVLEWFPQCDVSNSSKPGKNFVDARCLDGQPLLVLQAPAVATCGAASEPPDVCAISNTSPVQLFWSYTPKSPATGGDCTSSTNCAPAGSFFEGAIDVTGLIGNECISSFMAETRSSTSVTATLEDFTGPHAFNLCGISIQKSCPSNNIVHIANNGDTFQYTFGGVVQNTGVGTDHNVIVVDTFPGDASNITPAGNATCPTGSPVGAVCYSLGDMAGHTCKLWPNNTTIDCSTLVNGADPNAATDFASNTFQSPTNAAQNGASVTSTEISASAVSATCPTASGSPAINVAKTCSVTINSSLGVTVSYKGDVCNESNLTLQVSSQPTDVQLIPGGTTSGGTPTYTNKTLNFNLAACTGTQVDSTLNPTPCTPTQTCSDDGHTLTCTNVDNLANNVCAHYTGSYTPTQSSAGPDATGSAGTVCFKDQVTASAKSTLLNQSATNTNNPAASCPLCPGGGCPTP